MEKQGDIKKSEVVDGAIPWYKNETFLLAFLFSGLCLCASQLTLPGSTGPVIQLDNVIPDRLLTQLRGGTPPPTRSVASEEFTDDHRFEALLQDTDAFSGPVLLARAPVEKIPNEAVGNVGILKRPLFPLIADSFMAGSAASSKLSRFQQENASLHHALNKRLSKLGCNNEALVLPCLEISTDGQCKRKALDSFFFHLRRVALGRAASPARLSWFGDSLTAGDGFTGELRRLFQGQFGDGGHGFLPMRPPARFMGFQGAHVSYRGQWDVETLLVRKEPRPLGLMGAAFRRPRGASIKYRTRDENRHFDMLGVLWSAPDGTATVTLSWPGREQPLIQTLGGLADKPHVAWIKLNNENDGEINELDIRGFSPRATYYGVMVERSGPGVVVDNLGIIKGRAPLLLRNEREHFQTVLELRGTHLGVFFYGVNFATLGMPGPKRLARYRDRYAEVLTTARGPRSQRDCLVLSILTRGERGQQGVHHRASVGPLANTQQEAALKAGCAFWNMYKVMGGADGVKSWFNRPKRLIGTDLAHPTGQGYRYLARRLYLALLWAFDDYLQRGLPPSPLCTGGECYRCQRK